jgi:predicted nuclease of predicted toxin-antitoxin system
MVFLLDENMPFDLIDAIAKKGHTTHHVKKLGKTGIVNGEVYRLAIELDAWLITRDKDFRSLEKFARHDIAGIILLMSDHDLLVKEVLEIITGFLDRHENILTSKKLIEMEGDSFKVNE